MRCSLNDVILQVSLLAAFPHTGPEIMASTLDVLKAAGANLAIETIDIGEKLYLSGHSSGIAPASWDSLRRTKVFLKAPITTPIGGGYKSAFFHVPCSLILYKFNFLVLLYAGVQLFANVT